MPLTKRGERKHHWRSDYSSIVFTFSSFFYFSLCRYVDSSELDSQSSLEEIKGILFWTHFLFPTSPISPAHPVDYWALALSSTNRKKKLRKRVARALANVLHWEKRNEKEKKNGRGFGSTCFTRQETTDLDGRKKKPEIESGADASTHLTWLTN